MEPKEPVTVASVKSEAEAEIIRNFLHTEGIMCEIGGETAGGLAGVLSIPILVPAKDADQARKILAKHQQHGPGRKPE